MQRLDRTTGSELAGVEALATTTIGCALRLHRRLGPGLLESAYEIVLAASLVREGVAVERQVPITIEVDGLTIRDAFRVDMIVGGALLVEIKSVERIAPVHSKQLLTYLRLTNRSLGLLMNFGGETFKEGQQRVVNRHVTAAGTSYVAPPLSRH
ncbi:GxxExxY protein [Sphingomonas parva]|uniref:GxxExxY protein n=2 Tax=Sphingomonas parva TaxID=2555898 RepID=A0A4Y8ZKF1_9SPHN|nr:GxxExxY protein [Sphingomonas parva]